MTDSEPQEPSSGRGGEEDDVRQLPQRTEDPAQLEQCSRNLEKEWLLAAFQQIGQAVLETLDPDEILDRLATQIIEAGLFRSLMIALVREDERTVEVVRNYICLKGNWNEDAQVTPGRFIQTSDRVVLMRDGRNVATQKKITGTIYSLDDDNVTPTVARTGRMEVIEEWSDRFDQNAGDPDGRRGKVAYFIPVKKRDQVLAVLATGSQIQEKEATLHRIEMMHPLLGQMAIALEHARLFARVRQGQNQLEQRTRALEEKERLLTAFHRIGRAVLETLDPEEILDRLGEQIIEAGLFRSLMIALVDEDGGTFRVVRDFVLQADGQIRESSADPARSTNAGRVFSIQDLEDSGALAIRRKELVIHEGYGFDLHSHPQSPAERAKIAYFLPVLGRRGRVHALLGTASDPEEREIILHRIETMQPLLDQMAIALEHARLFARVRQGQNQLRALSRRLVEVQEEERRAVARELHDEIGQQLTGLKMFLEMSASAPTGALTQHLDNARQTVGRLMEQVRNLSHALRPSALDDLGLLPALQLLFRNLHDQTGVQVDFRHLGLDGRLSPDIEIGAYRIVQESLNNAVRHAGVSRVSVRVWKTADRLGLQIEDQGRGFDLDAIQTRETAGGLRGMQERVSLLAGEFSIESEPGAGTRITTELPLPQRKPRTR